MREPVTGSARTGHGAIVSRPARVARPPLALAAAMVIGVIGWIGLAWLGAALFGENPPKAGFDLQLLLDAGRRVAAGQSPYDPAFAGATGLRAEDLFYSYPPPVAQLLSLVAGVPSSVMLLAWDLGAIGGLVGIAYALARRLEYPQPHRVALVALGIAPLVMPFAVALLFGNLDAWFPLGYGLVLLGALWGGRGGWLLAGASVAILAVAKVHPAILGLWLLVRAIHDRSALFGVLSAIITASAVVAASLVVGGTAPWADYANVVRTSAAAGLIDYRNIGPAAQLAMLVGGGDGLARALHVGVVIVAVGLTIWSAWRTRDPVMSFAWATLASIVVLPITWYHYPVALLSVAIAALSRPSTGVGGRTVESIGRSRFGLLALAAAIALVAVAWPSLVWIPVALLLVVVHETSPDHGTPEPVPTLPA